MLAKALGVQPPSVSDWITGKKAVPLDRCTAIERATLGAVTRQDLRPDDWQEHWPELDAAQANANGASRLIAAPDLVAAVSDINAVVKVLAASVHEVIMPKAWDGVERRHQPWDGKERRSGADRRRQEVQEAPSAPTAN